MRYVRMMLTIMSKPLRIPLIALTFFVFVLPVHAAEAPEGVAPCLACHAADGLAADAVTPLVAGLRKKHVLAAMADYRSGERLHEEMQQAAQGLDDATLDMLAAWFSEQPWIASERPVDSDLAKAGSRKARASCSSCHRRSGEGGIGAPRLAGQSVDYLVAASTAYRDGGRTSPAARGKGFVMGDLTDDEILALSHYYASLR
ncbi:MAG: c-type cytochrome [Rhodospirillales bacterium]|nr:c-type cytochrome [Rhodospirillales bacterium]